MNDPMKILEVAHENSDEVVTLWYDQAWRIVRRLQKLSAKAGVEPSPELLALMRRLARPRVVNTRIQLWEHEYKLLLESHDNLLIAALGA